MTIIIVFPNFKNYPERLKLYYKMGESDSVDEMMIFTREIPENIVLKNNDKISIEIIKNKKQFYFGVKDIVRERIKNKKNIVIINHFINITPFFKKIKKDKNIKIITKFYFPNLIIFYSARKKIIESMKQTILFFKRAFYDIYSAVFSDIIVGNSEEIETLFRKLFKLFRTKREVITFATPVDTDFFHNIKKNRNNDPPRLLFVGNLLQRKGIFDLIEIARLLKQAKIDYKLYITGKFVNEKTKKRVFNMIKEYKIDNNLVFTGRMDKKELLILYNDSDIFLFPSYYEGSPRVIKEAIACGLPVVAYNIAGVRLIDNGNNIVQIVKTGDIKGMLKKTLELIDNKEVLKSLSIRGEIYIKKEFSIESIAKKELNLLSTLSEKK